MLERLRLAARARRDSQPTADTLVSWARAFILVHNQRHPSELGLPEVTDFLDYVVKTAPEPLRALAQARSTLVRRLLGIGLGELPQPRPPRVLDQFRLVLRVRHYSRRTEDGYTHGARRFILFHCKRHPRTMNAAEVEQFLTHLAVQERVSASTQNQALNALRFCYGQVLEIDLGRRDAVRARRGQRLPIVLTPEEVRLVLGHVRGAGAGRQGVQPLRHIWLVDLVGRFDAGSGNLHQRRGPSRTGRGSGWSAADHRGPMRLAWSPVALFWCHLKRADSEPRLGRRPGWQGAFARWRGGGPARSIFLVFSPSSRILDDGELTPLFQGGALPLPGLVQEQGFSRAATRAR